MRGMSGSTPEDEEFGSGSCRSACGGLASVTYGARLAATSREGGIGAEQPPACCRMRRLFLGLGQLGLRHPPSPAKRSTLRGPECRTVQRRGRPELRGPPPSTEAGQLGGTPRHRFGDGDVGVCDNVLCEDRGGHVGWDVLAGIVGWWADEGLRDVGRSRFHRRHGGPSGPPDPELGEVRVRSVFVARRCPWRLAQIPLEGHQPAVVAWADEATAVLSGKPANQRVLPPGDTWGDNGLGTMLDPSPLEQLLPKPWPPELSLEGSTLEENMFLVPPLVSLSADRYVAAYDDALDVLTAWTAYIEGSVAQRITLTQLATIDVDEPGG